MPELTGQLHTVAYESDLPEQLAQFILDNAPELPNLADVTLVLADARLATPLRKTFLELAKTKQHNALLGPTMTDFESWWPTLLPQLPVCSYQESQLILADALLNFKGLLQKSNVWSLADTLLDLFNELTLSHIELHDSHDTFYKQLGSWYAIKDRTYTGLQHEAQIIHELWHAWHHELKSRKLIDPARARLMALQKSIDTAIDKQLHFVGLDLLYKAEQQWQQTLLEKHNIHFWQQQGLLDSSDKNILSDKQQLLRHAFKRDGESLQQRSNSATERLPESALHSNLMCFAASGSEHEAHAIDYQVRKWLTQGKQHVAVVTENRRIARRLRALFERANIHLQDQAGWAVSTTRAAATLEALLECIEDDFNHVPFLDLLKSHFIFFNQDSDTITRQVYRLEHDIVQNEQIGSGIQHYLTFIMDRKQRLADIWAAPIDDIVAMLQQTSDATHKLQLIRNGKHKLSYFIETLIDTLNGLEIKQGFLNDAAGEKILALLEHLHESAKQIPLQISWNGFRACLGHLLESQFFIPEQSGSSVQLLTLGQSQFQSFDAVVIAGCEQEYFPGDSQRNPFFNQSVRHALHLPTRETLDLKRLNLFIDALNCASQVLVTYRQEEHGEALRTSPWVLTLRHFHELAYGTDLEAEYLHSEVREPSSHVINCDTGDLPGPATSSSVTIPEDMIPTDISASAYNQLVSCPYQYFASRCLALSPPEEISDALSKREYGERVHQCLQAFFTNVDGLPGPFDEKVSKQNSGKAIELLNNIADEVFAEDIKNSFLSRGWLQRWKQAIPDFINWQAGQQSDILQTEQKINVTVSEQLTLKGQIDRIDTSEDELRIIDYKTGGIKTKQEILTGEDVQLPFYAYLAQMEQSQDINTVEYVHFEKDRVNTKHQIKHETLSELVPKIQQRLIDMLEALHHGQPLPAWEDKQACQWCRMKTLCRVGSWDT